MRNTYKILHLPILLIAILITSCTTLDPVSQPEEFTPAPSGDHLWKDLQSIRPGDWYSLLNDGPTALDWRLRSIDTATSSIELQTFLWDLDTTGRLILKHIITAADRGVKVRILIDDTFLLSEDDMLLALHEHPNIEYRIFNPNKRRANSFLTRQVLNLGEFHRLDHRMHNKSMVIDNRIAIIGGRNLADEYFGLHDKANFRDLELLVGGPIVQDISQAFDRYWNDRWSVSIDQIAHVKPSPERLITDIQEITIPKGVHYEETVQQRNEQWKSLVRRSYTGKAKLIVDRPPENNPADAAEAPIQVAEKLQELIDNALSEILVITAYLIPSEHLEQIFGNAVERGVRVRVLTNSIRSNNHLTAHSAYRNHIKTLLTNGVELHEVRIDARDRDVYMLSPTEKKSLALHAKALLIDGQKVFIGSANLDPRSLRINTEMGLLVESKALGERLKGIVGPDYDSANAWQLNIDQHGRVSWVSDYITLDSMPAAGFMQRIEDWFFSLLPLDEEL